MENESRTILVCRGTGCESTKSPEIQRALEEGLSGTDIEVKFTGCHGMCQQGPIVIVEPDDTFYAKVKNRDVKRILDQHIEKGETVERLVYQDPNTKEPGIEEMTQLLEETKKRGLLIGKGGRWGNVVRIQPPYALTKGQIDEGVASLDEAFTAVERS